MSLSDKFEKFNEKKTKPEKPAGLKPPKPPSKKSKPEFTGPPKKMTKNEVTITGDMDDLAEELMSRVAQRSEFRRLIVVIANMILDKFGMNDYKTNIKVATKVMNKNFNNNIEKAAEEIRVNPNNVKAMLIHELKGFVKDKKLTPVKIGTRTEMTDAELDILIQKSMQVQLEGKHAKKLAKAREEEKRRGL